MARHLSNHLDEAHYGHAVRSFEQRDARGLHPCTTNAGECEIRTNTLQRRGKSRRVKIAGRFPGDDQDLTHA